MNPQRRRGLATMLAGGLVVAATALVVGSASSPVAAATDVVIAAAGDIACDPTDANYNGGLGTASFCRQEATAALLDRGGYDAILPLGDQQYIDGTLPKFQQVYDRTWGRSKALHRPVPGNHEYLDPGAAGYYDYYGALAGERGKGWYSYNLGPWHIVALNGECAEVGGCGVGSAQETWLRADLAANPSQCTLAYWHEPKFSSVTPTETNRFQAFWTALQAAGAEVVLNGHHHNYERFAPQLPSGVADPSGIRQFVVGTGGKGLVGFAGTASNSEVRNSTTYGVLKLTLRAGSYAWEFVPVAGSSFTDVGSGTCSGPAPTTAGPVPTTAGPAPTTAGPAPTTAGPIPSTGGPVPTGPAPTTAGPGPTTAGPAPTTSGPAPTAASPVPSECNPTVKTTPADLRVGQVSTVEVSGLPAGRRVALEGYSRPSTTYAELRQPTAAGADGVVRFDLRPATNTRLRVRVADCSVPGDSAVIVVHPVLTLRVTRDAPRSYTFAGSILPAAQNNRRLITLYYRPAEGAEVRRAVMNVRPDGSYSVPVRFSGSARLTFVIRTGADMTNAEGISNPRSVLVY